MQDKVVLIDYEEKLELANMDCEGVLFNNKMNIMNKYNFREIIRIKEYWGYRFLDAWCKECNCKSCKYTNVFFVKELK